MKQHDIFIKKKKKKSKKSLWNKLPLQGNLKRERKKMSNDNKKKKELTFNIPFVRVFHDYDFQNQRFMQQDWQE